MKRLLVSLLLVLSLTGCAYVDDDNNYDIGYDAGYDEGYNDGIFDGKSLGREEVYQELVDEGVLRETELVYLSNNGEEVFHNFYCEQADHEKEIERSIAESWGYLPCESCGGDGFRAYASN